MNYSLSNHDIYNLLDYKCNIIPYEDIINYKNINELLGKYKKCIILYKSSHDFGHWTCIYENKGKIYFFDSYGFKPNAQLKFIPNQLNKSLNQNHDYLLKMLYDTKKPIEFNEYPLQKLDTKINTCGRWVVFRLKHPGISVDDFNKLFINKKKLPDELITKLVSIKNKK